MTYVLAIDQSTSATKALLLDAAGKTIAKASQDHRQIYPQPGWVEHDAEEIWQNTVAVVREVATHGPPKRLSITNQRETIVVFDRDSGEPHHNAIVWQCRRGDPICQQLRAEQREAEVRRQTGLMIDTYFSASKIRWLGEHVPEVRQSLLDGTALVGTIDTYLIYRLTGGQVFATDHTNASRTLLYDIHQLDWSDFLCELFRVPRTALAEIRDSNADYGITDVAGVLEEPIPIRGVMGDSQASLFALGCHHIGDTKITFGTGSSLLFNIGEQLPAASHPDEDAATEPDAATPEATVATVAWVIDGRPTYCLEGIISYSAATIQWLRDQLQLIESPAETQALAESVDGNDGVYLVPAFAGLSAPYWSADSRAAIIGMTAHTTRAHVVRAALESIAYQVRDVLEMMRDQTGVTPHVIHADGGATSNGFLMQFTADISDTEVRIGGVAEASPLGAALCGSIGDEVNSIDQLPLPPSNEQYRRQLSSEAADSCYASWKQAVQRVL